MSDATASNRKPSGVYYALAATLALLIGLTLQFSALGKLLHPNPNLFFFEAGTEGWENGLLRDYVIAAVEMLLVVGLLLLHRWKYAWAPTCVFFGGLLGYSSYALITGLDCGCFGGLWTPPKGFTVGLNAAFIVGSLLALFLGRAHKLVIVGTLVLTLGGAGVGYYQAGVDRPDPKKIIEEDRDGVGPLDKVEEPEDTTEPASTEGEDPGTPDAPVASARPATLFDIPEVAAMMAFPQGQQLGYIFLHEEGCTTCEQFKPFIELERDDYLAQGYPLEVVMIEINELERDYGIPRDIWTSTPTLVCIDGGEIVFYDRGEDIKLPSELLDLWLAGADLGGRDPADDFDTR